MIYNLDFELFAVRNLPVKLRQPKLLAYLKVALHPLVALHQSFLDLRVKTNKELSFNSQKLVFEYLLNERFDAVQRGIFITNISNLNEAVFIYKQYESEPNPYLYKRAEIVADNSLSKLYVKHQSELSVDTDFVVYVPNSVVDISINNDVKAEIDAVAQKYKFAGKRYKILNYE